ncbi:unnamed protein product, partial [Lymnaea stagnalis]
MITMLKKNEFTLLDGAKDDPGQALLRAAKTGDVAQAKYLAKKCPNLNIKDDTGNTPLMLLIGNCKVEDTDDRAAALSACSYLILHGADVNAKNSAGLTPLMLVVSRHFRHNMTDLLELLVDHGANPDLVDTGGDKALTHALRSRTAIHFIQTNVNWLLLNGADPFIGVHNYKLVCSFLSQILDFETQGRVTLNHISRLIKAGKVELLRFLVCNCALDMRCATFDALSGYSPEGETLKGLSPLMLALLHDRADIAKYFIVNGFLTDLDLKREPLRFRNSLSEGPKDLLRKLHSQPWPLSKLSLWTVSALLGPLPQRADMVGRTKLSDTVKQLLVFQGPMSRVCSHLWEKLPVKTTCDYTTVPCLRPLVLNWPHGRGIERKCACCLDKVCKDLTSSSPTLDSETKCK